MMRGQSFCNPQKHLREEQLGEKRAWIHDDDDDDGDDDDGISVDGDDDGIGVDGEWVKQEARVA
jgi:hypothetical protein